MSTPQKEKKRKRKEEQNVVAGCKLKSPKRTCTKQSFSRHAPDVLKRILGIEQYTAPPTQIVMRYRVESLSEFEGQLLFCGENKYNLVSLQDRSRVKQTISATNSACKLLKSNEFMRICQLCPRLIVFLRNVDVECKEDEKNLHTRTKQKLLYAFQDIEAHLYIGDVDKWMIRCCTTEKLSASLSATSRMLDRLHTEPTCIQTFGLYPNAQSTAHIHTVRQTFQQCCLISWMCSRESSVQPLHNCICADVGGLIRIGNTMLTLDTHNEKLTFNFDADKHANSERECTVSALIGHMGILVNKRPGCGRTFTVCMFLRKTYQLRARNSENEKDMASIFPTLIVTQNASLGRWIYGFKVVCGSGFKVLVILDTTTYEQLCSLDTRRYDVVVITSKVIENTPEYMQLDTDCGQNFYPATKLLQVQTWDRVIIDDANLLSMNIKWIRSFKAYVHYKFMWMFCTGNINNVIKASTTLATVAHTAESDKFSVLSSHIQRRLIHTCVRAMVPNEPYALKFMFHDVPIVLTNLQRFCYDYEERVRKLTLEDMGAFGSNGKLFNLHNIGAYSESEIISDALKDMYKSGMCANVEYVNQLIRTHENEAFVCNQECTICMCVVDDGSICMMRCGHVVCEECLVNIIHHKRQDQIRSGNEDADMLDIPVPQDYEQPPVRNTHAICCPMCRERITAPNGCLFFPRIVRSSALLQTLRVHNVRGPKLHKLWQIIYQTLDSTTSSESGDMIAIYTRLDVDYYAISDMLIENNVPFVGVSSRNTDTPCREPAVARVFLWDSKAYLGRIPLTSVSTVVFFQPVLQSSQQKPIAIEYYRRALQQVLRCDNVNVCVNVYQLYIKDTIEDALPDSTSLIKDVLFEDQYALSGKLCEE